MIIKKNNRFLIKTKEYNNTIKNPIIQKNNILNNNIIKFPNNIININFDSYNEININQNLNGNLLPNNIYLIWFGDKLPKYIYYTLQQYGLVNYNFNIYFIHYHKNDILYKNNNDQVLKISKQYIDDYLNNIQNRYTKYIKYRVDNKFTYLQILSDIYRIEIIRYFGGIYVDVDTLPLKNFNSLLEKTAFCQEILDFQQINMSINFKYRKLMDIQDLIDFNNIKIIPYDDNFFISGIKNFTDDDIQISPYFKIKHKEDSIQWVKNFEVTDYFKKIKEKFYNNQLNEIDIKNLQSKYWMYYLIHFSSKNWDTKTIQENSLFCDLDYELYPNLKKHVYLKDTINYLAINDVQNFTKQYILPYDYKQNITTEINNI